MSYFPVFLFLLIAFIFSFFWYSMSRIPYDVHLKMNRRRNAKMVSAEQLMGLCSKVDPWHVEELFPDSLFTEDNDTALHASLFQINGQYYTLKSHHDFNKFTAYYRSIISSLTYKK